MSPLLYQLSYTATSHVYPGYTTRNDASTIPLFENALRGIQKLKEPLIDCDSGMQGKASGNEPRGLSTKIGEG